MKKCRFLRGVMAGCLALMVASTAMAVPAKRGWQTMTQPDGTTIQVEQRGDEFYHYWVNESGQEMKRDANGYWQVVGSEPNGNQVAARRAASPMKMAPRKAVGTSNYKNNKKGLVILVSFKDVAFKQSQSDMNLLCNGDKDLNYTYNGAVGSVAKYFSDQSNGQYVPEFTVVGPVTLSQNRSYYGSNVDGEDGADAYAGDMIVEACQLVDNQINFADYASGTKVNFVYVIYAGQGEADGGPDESVWPHNWTLSSASYYGNCTYTAAQRKFDGVTVDDYACSAELRGSVRAGVGTLCHEFSHVIGMPDYYDVEYGSNYNNSMTPGEWTIMDGGSYNSDGNCPPNYSIFDKYYMGWATPTNLNSPALINMAADGTGYQVNNAGALQAYSNTNEQYYIENRQQNGWDAGLPGHGMVIWKVKYDQTAWNDNKPNATTGTIRYAIISAKGNTTGICTKTDSYGAANPFPGTAKKTSYTPFSQYPITGITESNGTVQFVFISSPDCHNVVTNGTNCTITPSTSCVENSTQLTATITPTDATYDITSVSVKRGTTTLTNGTNYSLSGNVLTINASAISGSSSDAITISATATKNRWNYVVAYENATSSAEDGMVNKGGTLNLTITPVTGYLITNSCFEVTMGGSAYTGFTYNTSTGAFSIANVTGEVEIMVTPTMDPEYIYEFLPVTDIAMLNANAKVLIVYDGATPALMGKTLTSGYMNAVTSGFTYKDNGNIEVFKESATVNILTLGKSSSNWTFTNTNSQLMGYSSSNITWGSGTTTWTITIVNNKTATIQPTGSGYPIYYNSSRFKPYSSAQQSIKLFVEKNSVTQQTTTITFAKGTGAQSVKENSYFVNKATSNFGVVTYTSSNTAFATVEADGSVTGVAPGTATITASVAEGQYYTAAQAQYQITVVALQHYTQTWSNNGTPVTTTDVVEGNTLVLPDAGYNPAACSNGKKFIGWTAAANYPYSSETVAPALAQAGQEVTGDATYYAVFAIESAGDPIEVSRAMTSFATVADDVADDENVSYAASQGTSATPPAANGSEIRIYQNGGLLTVTGNNGCKLKSVTIGSSMGTTVQVSVDGGDFGSNQSITANGTYTINNQNADEIVFKCTGTSKTTRLYLNRLGVTYIGGVGKSYTYFATNCDGTVEVKTDPTCSFEEGSKTVTVESVFTNALTTNSDGAKTFTSSNTSVATVNSSTGEVTAVAAGSTTIQVAIAGTATYNPIVRSYELTVVRKQATASFATAEVNMTVGGDTYQQSVVSNSDGLITYSSSNEGIASVNASTGIVTAHANGTVTITAQVSQTATYTNTSASYTVNVTGGATVVTCTSNNNKVSNEYYRSLDGLSGKELFDAVHDVAKVGFASLSYAGLWTAYEKTDIYPEDSARAGHIWDMYGACDFVYSTNQCGSGDGGSTCDCYNREHSIPKSWFGGSTSTGTPGTDIFHVVPADSYVNTMRSNNAFGEVNVASYSFGGSKLGTPKSITTENTIFGVSTTGSCSGTVFEPADEFKGDFARGYMGTLVRWANGDYQTFSTADGASIFSTSSTLSDHYGLTQYGVALLMKWHRQDPVSQKEIDRNNAIQNTQGNRNPFIDYPELAEYIWGSATGSEFDVDAVSPTFCAGGGGVQPVITYTVTLYRDGVSEEVSGLQGTYVLPANEDAPCASWTFAGWSTTNTEETAEKPTMATQTSSTATFYAIYSKATGGSGASTTASITKDAISANGYGTLVTREIEGLTWGVMAYNNGGYWQLNKGKKAYVKLPELGGTISSITISLYNNSSSQTLGISTEEYAGTAITTVAEGTGSGSTITISSPNVTTGYIWSKTGTVSISSISVTYAGGATLKYDATPDCSTELVVPTFAFADASETIAFGEIYSQAVSTNSDGTPQYISSNTGVATVGDNGAITTVGVGNTRITAQVAQTANYYAANAYYDLTVTNIANAISFSNPVTAVAMGQKVTNVATATHGTIVYSSSNTSVATVASTGEVTPVSEGTAIIRAEVAADNENHIDGAKTSYEILVIPAAGTIRVHWKVDGVDMTGAVAEHLYKEDGSEYLLIPAAPDDCGVKKFIGWTQQVDYYHPLGVAPEDLFTEKSMKVTEEITYYAVFSSVTK